MTRYASCSDVLNDPISPIAYVPYYDTMPDGLISIPDAARQYDLPVPRLRRWITVNILTCYGRLIDASPTGGMMLVLEDDVRHLKETPPRMGRPPKPR